MSDEKSTADGADVDDASEPNPLEQNIKSRNTWTRFLFMLISAVLLGVTGMVGSFVVVLGFFWVLFTGEVNRQLQTVGQSIASYVGQIIRYLTFNSEQKPFPLGGEWPSGEAD